MDDYIVKDDEFERKRKQDYLIKTILEAGYDSDQFADFMNQERNGGCNIDLWSFEELETMVVLFKRQAATHPPETELAFRLEDVELNDDERSIYAKRVRTSIKAHTQIGDSQAYILV